MFNPLSETCVQATPLILAGLAVALPYQAGLFNIGGQSQFIGGAIVATYLGYGVSLPPVIHVIVCVLGSFAGGAAIGWVVGELKARTGAHEVIVTIMMNYIMAYFLAYLLSYHYLIQAPGTVNPITSPIASDAHLPLLFGTHLRINAGFLIALACAAGVWWLLERTTIGFEFRSVGKNPSAARVAGMNVERNWVLVMADRGRPGRPGRLDRHPGHRLHPQRPELRDLRHRRHHGRAARPGPAGRRGVGRPAVRGAARRGAAHAGRYRHAGGHGAGAGGGRRPDDRRTAADPSHLPAARRGRRPPGAGQGVGGMTVSEQNPTVLYTGVALGGTVRRWLAPATFLLFGLIDIFVLGHFAHPGDATFAFSQPFAKVTVPNLTLPARRDLLRERRDIDRDRGGARVPAVRQDAEAGGHRGGLVPARASRCCAGPTPGRAPRSTS